MIKEKTIFSFYNDTTMQNKIMNNWQNFLKDHPSLGLADGVKQNEQHFLFDLSHYGLIKVSGLDAKKFLQGQLTCDVNGMTSTESRMGAHCNPQGRIISLFYLAFFHEHYYLCMPRSMIPIAITALKKYAVFFKVELIDISNEWMILGSTGPMTSTLHSTETSLIIKMHPDASLIMIIGESAAIKKNYASFIDQAAIGNNHAWKQENIRYRLPIIYPETSGKFLPHELHLHTLHAISFEKGCYTGQEIIARMHYKAKLKNHSYIMQSTESALPQPGADIYCQQDENKRICGMVIDACYLDNHHYSVLVVAEESSVKNNYLFLQDEKQFLKIID